MPRTHIRPCRAAAPLAVLAVLLAACGPGGGASRADAKAKDDRPPLVRVAKVEVRPVQREIETTAFLESEHEVIVYSKISGRITEVPVDEGQRVKKGQLLARLDDREATTTLRQAEIQLEERQLRQQLAKLDAEASLRKVEQARIDRDRAKAEFVRQSQIDPNLVSPKVVEESKFALDAAEEAMRVAEFAARRAELDVGTSANAIRELQSKVEETRLRLAEHEILAPLDGVVVRRDVKGGETVGVNTSLFRVTDPDNLISYLSRPQRELPLVRRAREVRFTVDGFPAREFKGAIDLVSPVVEQATGSFRLRIRVDPEDADELRPGMFLRARILTEERRDALMVPKAAVIAEGERSIVYAVRNGQTHKVVVDPGLEERLFLECRNRGDEGLATDDVVVVSGHSDLRDKMLVEVHKEGP